MFFEMQEFYYKDVYFCYSDKNVISYIDAFTSTSSNIDNMYYDVDYLDDTVNQYDILPTLGLPLVSQRFFDLFKDKLGKDINLIPAFIMDSEGRVNSHFYALQVLTCYECIDFVRSQISYKNYGNRLWMTIENLIIDMNKVGSASIFSLKEKHRYIIVNKAVKEQCEKLKGFEFKCISE